MNLNFCIQLPESLSLRCSKQSYQYIPTVVKPDSWQANRTASSLPTNAPLCFFRSTKFSNIWLQFHTNWIDIVFPNGDNATSPGSYGATAKMMMPQIFFWPVACISTWNRGIDQFYNQETLTVGHLQKYIHVCANFPIHTRSRSAMNICAKTLSFSRNQRNKKGNSSL